MKIAPHQNQWHKEWEVVLANCSKFIKKFLIKVMLFIEYLFGTEYGRLHVERSFCHHNEYCIRKLIYKYVLCSIKYTAYLFDWNVFNVVQCFSI